MKSLSFLQERVSSRKFRSRITHNSGNIVKKRKGEGTVKKEEERKGAKPSCKSLKVKQMRDHKG